MPFSADELKKLENPYQYFKQREILIENLAGLDSLSLKDQQRLAEQIVLECPKDEMTALGFSIAEAKENKNNSTFLMVIDKPYEVKEMILNFFKSTAINSHELLFMPANPLLVEFNALSLKVFEGHESAVAEKLALQVHQTRFNQLSRTINELFPQSRLRAKVFSAFLLFTQIKRNLLLDSPQDFFLSREFSSDACNEFTKICSALIHSREKEIAEKLAFSQNTKAITELQLLANSTQDTNAPFKKLYIAVTQQSKMKTDSTLYTLNRNALHYPKDSKNKKYTTIEKVMGDVPEDSEEDSEEDSCCSIS